MPSIKRKTWDLAAMIQAANAVRKNEMGYLKAVKRFGVLKGTFERYVKKDGLAKGLVQVRRGRQPALPHEPQGLTSSNASLGTAASVYGNPVPSTLSGVSPFCT